MVPRPNRGIWTGAARVLIVILFNNPDHHPHCPSPSSLRVPLRPPSSTHCNNWNASWWMFYHIIRIPYRYWGTVLYNKPKKVCIYIYIYMIRVMYTYIYTYICTYIYIRYTYNIHGQQELRIIYYVAIVRTVCACVCCPNLIISGTWHTIIAHHLYRKNERSRRARVNTKRPGVVDVRALVCVCHAHDVVPASITYVLRTRCGNR